jgi:hypothetical protein
LYRGRGLDPKKIVRTPVYRFAQDLSSRVGIRAGLIQPPDYRQELEALIRSHFPSRRAFCQKTGISEAMLSHVLAGRKDLSLATLETALNRVGYLLRIAPTTHNKRTG